MRTEVAVDIHAPISAVWADVSDLTSHVNWMKDAKEIRLRSSSHEGVGTEFECLTQVGPLRTLDVLRVTEWIQGNRITMEHLGTIHGTGTIALTAFGSITHVIWSEEITFPWWLGGNCTGMLAKPVLHELWSSNLQRLKRICEEKYRIAQASPGANRRDVIEHEKESADGQRNEEEE